MFTISILTLQIFFLVLSYAIFDGGITRKYYLFALIFYNIYWLLSFRRYNENSRYRIYMCVGIVVIYFAASFISCI